MNGDTIETSTSKETSSTYAMEPRGHFPYKHIGMYAYVIINPTHADPSINLYTLKNSPGGVAVSQRLRAAVLLKFIGRDFKGCRAGFLLSIRWGALVSGR